jgi:hypothetical protein
MHLSFFEEKTFGFYEEGILAVVGIESMLSLSQVLEKYIIRCISFRPTTTCSTASV